MNALQHIHDLPVAAHAAGVRHMVLSPGSRSAAPALAFWRYQGIECHVVPDERSAAFIALGMAQALKEPVAVLCTSGTAALNYSPAVAEAYFAQVPLVVLTADRPPELIDQWVGQTIFQENLYGKHAKAWKNYAPRVHTAQEHRQALDQAYELFCAATAGPPGPIHLNLPIREPFYPTEEQPLTISQELNFTAAEPTTYKSPLPIGLEKALETSQRTWLLVGHGELTEAQQQALRDLADQTGWPMVAEAVGNPPKGALLLADLWVHQIDDTSKPTLLISVGKSLVSKRLRNFFRGCPALQHWHLSAWPESKDPFSKLAGNWVNPVESSLLELASKALQTTPTPSLAQELEDRVRRHLEYAVANIPFGELWASHALSSHLPPRSMLHLGNSMPVRLGNTWAHTLGQRQVRVRSNRGTAGIDGCTSTALGDSWVNTELVTLLTGDLSFLYDRNAFLHTYPTENLRVVVLNNGGGAIFRRIAGPSSQPELEQVFVANPQRRMSSSATDAGLEYYFCDTKESLTACWQDFFAPAKQGKLLEVYCPESQDSVFIQDIMQQLWS